MKNLFIFEGADFSSKTTQIKLLEKKLISLGKKVKVTREPGGTSLGEKIRDILLNSEEEISKETEVYLFAASRRAHNEKITQWIQEGYTVLCDRHLLSSLVLQSTPELSYSQIINTNKLAMEPIKSIINGYTTDSQVIFLNISLKTYKERMKERSKTQKLDNIEVRYDSDKKISDMLDLYRETSYVLNSIEIDANRSIEEIHMDIINIL